MFLLEAGRKITFLYTHEHGRKLQTRLLKQRNVPVSGTFFDVPVLCFRMFAFDTEGSRPQARSRIGGRRPSCRSASFFYCSP